VSDTPVVPEAEKVPAPEAPKPAKRGLLKKVVLGVVVVGAAVLLIGRAMLPGIIKGKIEEQGSATLGVPVTVGDIGFSILGGSLTIEDFAIAQPAGFSSQPFYSFDKFHASVSVSDLIGGKVTVETVQMDKPVLRIERNADGKKNFEIIQANAEKNTPKDDSKPDEKDSSESNEEKEFLLEEFIVRDLQVVLADASAGQITFDQAEYSVRNVHMIPGSKAPSWFTLEWKGLALSALGSGRKLCSAEAVHAGRNEHGDRSGLAGGQGSAHQVHPRGSAADSLGTTRRQHRELHRDQRSRDALFANTDGRSRGDSRK
jgi:hypothetical protein